MSRLLYIDLINIFACFSVIVLHCNGYSHSIAMDTSWFRAMTAEVLFFPAVPLFYMLTGATLFDFEDRYDERAFFKKRFKRTVVPFLFWSVSFYVLSALDYYFTGNLEGDYTSWTYFLQSLLKGNIHFTAYWFFVPLFLIYLAIPFLAKSVRAVSPAYLVVVSSVIFAVMGVVNPLLQLVGVDFSFCLPIAGYIAYPILGYALYKADYHENVKTILLLTVLSLASYAVRFGLVVYTCSHHADLFSYFAPYAVLPAATLFLAFRRFARSLKLNSGLVSEVSSLSFGIYLLHVPFISILAKFAPTDTILCQTIGCILVYFSTALFVWFIRKFSWGRVLCP